MVTLLAAPLELVVGAAGAVVVGVAAVDAAGVDPVLVDGLESTDATEALRAARAGSWPETSTTAISSHVATNIDREPAISRRRIILARAARACLVREDVIVVDLGSVGAFSVPQA